MEAVLFVGIQASGKSTFYYRRFFDTHVRVNLDMLRTRHRERVLVGACLDAKQPFVVDNTNITRADRAAYISAARTAGFRVEGYYFRPVLQDAIARNDQRAGRGRIPTKGIVGTLRRLEMPRLDEGFDRLHHIEIDTDGRFVVTEWQGEV